MKPVSELLSQSWLIFQKHFPLFAGYAAWPLLPYAGLVLLSLPKPNFVFDGLTFFCLLVQGILALWVGVVIPLIARDLIKGQKKILLIDLQNRAWQLMLSVIFVAILESAVFLGGLILLIVPAIIFWVWFAMSQMAVIFDGQKGLSALVKSRELARGRFFALAWRLLAGPLFLLITVISLSGLIIIGTAVLTGAPMEIVFGSSPPLWVDLISTVIETFFMPLFLVYFTLLYLDLNSNSSQA